MYLPEQKRITFLSHVIAKNTRHRAILLDPCLDNGATSKVSLLLPERQNIHWIWLWFRMFFGVETNFAEDVYWTRPNLWMIRTGAQGGTSCWYVLSQIESCREENRKKDFAVKATRSASCSVNFRSHRKPCLIHSCSESGTERKLLRKRLREVPLVWSLSDPIMVLTSLYHMDIKLFEEWRYLLCTLWNSKWKNRLISTKKKTVLCQNRGVYSLNVKPSRTQRADNCRPVLQ